ncbi:MAG: mandelate racemase, partial [Variibacter sp.]|nr:mandelate racemase [Variibacter sp.]
MPPSQPAMLTIRGVRSVAVDVPMQFALGTTLATLRSAPLLLVDVETEEGVTGRTYLFCYRPSGARAIAELIADAIGIIKGQRAAPADVAATLARRFGLFGNVGAARMALSAIDAALWDAVAHAHRVPLCVLLGSAPRAIPAYNSCGLGLMGEKHVVEEAQKLLERGFRAVKLRLGYPTLAEDLAVLRALRKSIDRDVAVPVDFNQGLGLVEALARGRALQEEGILWIEEPIRHDDYTGNAQLARDLHVPIQLGENFNGPQGMAEALTAKACDLVMPDLARIGGVTGWMHAAGLAAAHGIPMSSHLFSEQSAHLLAATQTCHWLEYMDWAEPVLREPLQIKDGQAIIPDGAGSGIAWNDKAVA